MSLSKKNFIAFCCATGFALAPYHAYAASQSSASSKFFAAQLCATGQTVFIKIPTKDKDRESPKHQISACHAVCAQTEEDEDGSL